MIEFCTKKRMALAIVILVIVSVLVLILENGISAFHNHDLKDLTTSPNDSDAGKCWLKEKFTVQSNCVKCSDFEVQMKQPFCTKTGYKQEVKCAKSGKKYRSCDDAKDPAVEERNFWIFEAIALLLGLVSYGVVFLRQKKLDKHFLEKINKQIASGV